MLDRKLVTLLEEMVLSNDAYAWAAASGRSHVTFAPMVGGYQCDLTYYRDDDGLERSTTVFCTEVSGLGRMASLSISPQNLEATETEALRLSLLELTKQVGMMNTFPVIVGDDVD